MKTNKGFVQMMIIGSIVGLIILMGMMFMGIRWILEQEKDSTTITKPAENGIEEQVEQVIFNSTILGVITQLSSTEITVFDMKKQQQISTAIQASTKVTDSYDKIMPVDELVVGDVVELSYEPQEDKLIEISIAKGVWKKSDLTGVEIDRSNRTIKIGTYTYTYTDHTLMLNKEGESIGAYEVGDYDVLVLKGIGDEIYSIQSTQEQGYIELRDLPIYEGVIEINTNRHIPLSVGMAPIPIGEGVHRVVLQLIGYEPVIQQIEVPAGETFVITGENATQSYTKVNLKVLNEDVDYQVKIGETTYQKDEQIRVVSGRYPLSISAVGYQTWEGYIILEEPEVYIQITLIKEEVEENAPEEVPDLEQQPEEDDTQPEGDTNEYSVSISTEPEGARVYIDGVYKGNTPYKINLELGEYVVTVEKEGYETYKTNVLIDSPDQTNTYRYILIPEE